jgi:hypothetical protein
MTAALGTNPNAAATAPGSSFTPISDEISDTCGADLSQQSEVAIAYALARSEADRWQRSAPRWAASDALAHEIATYPLVPRGQLLAEGSVGSQSAARLDAIGAAPRLANVVAIGEGRFEFASDVHEAKGATKCEAWIVPICEGGAVTDVLAFRPASPDRWRLLTGAAWALGADEMLCPVRMGTRPELRLWSTPLAWVRTGGVGAFILDWKRAREFVPQFGDRQIRCDWKMLAIRALRELTPERPRLRIGFAAEPHEVAP